MVVYPRRVSSSKRGTKRRRTGAAVSRTRRPTRTRPARMSRKRRVKRPGAMSSASARAYSDASRWHHLARLRCSRSAGAVYSCRRCVTRKAVTAPTGLGAAYYIFVWSPSQVRCMWIRHQADQVDGYFRVHFPFWASHSQGAGPSMIRPLRQSVSLRNISASRDDNGYVRVLHTNHPMYSETD